MLLKQTSQAPGHNILGDSRKYPYHTMDGFFWNSEGKNWGVRVRGLWTGDLKAWMDSCITGIRRASRNLHREQTFVFLKNGDVMALIINYRFPKRAQIDDTVYDCRSRIEDKHQSIRHVFVFICRRKLTKCVLYFKLQRPWYYKTSFFLLSKQPDYLSCQCQICSFNWGHHCWPRWLKLKMLEIHWIVIYFLNVHTFITK